MPPLPIRERALAREREKGSVLKKILAYKRRLRVTVSKMAKGGLNWRHYGAAALIGARAGRSLYHEGRDLFRVGRGVVRGVRRVGDMVKRKWSGSRSSASKRRRFSRRRVGGNRPKRFVSAQYGGVVSANVGRRRRLKGRSYKRALFRTTIFKNHYRSIFDNSGITNAPGDINLAQVNSAFVLPGTGAQFWTTGGGALPSDVGVPVPTFNGDIIIRGGMARATFSNNGSTDGMRIRLWLAKTGPLPDLGLLATAVATPQRTSWDPTVLVDFSKFGRILRGWEFLLTPGQVPMTIRLPLRAEKVDQTVHNNVLGRRLVWIWSVSQTSNLETIVNPSPPPDTLPAPQPCTTHFSHNLSFVGDAV